VNTLPPALAIMTAGTPTAAAPTAVAPLASAASDALWRFDSVSVMLLVLTVVIAAAVLPYAHRSLRGDQNGVIVTVALALMLVATAVVSIAGPLWMLAIAWTTSTAATLIALGCGGGRRAIVRGAPWLLVADVFLWSAVLLIATGASNDAVALLLVAAAVVRCALPPAHVWLVDSLYAPTPVSAALHGGIVNGGGILVITQFATIAQSDIAIITLAAVAAVAIAVGVLVSLVRTDVKGRLVMSTVAQMGFMLMCAALGLIAAALLHLVAHGFYKSALFLASNDGIDRRAAERRAPRPPALSEPSRWARTALGALVPVATLVLTALAIYPGGRGLGELVVLIVLAAAFGAAGSRLTMLVPGTARAVGATLAVSGIAAAYVALTSALTLAVGMPATVTSLGTDVAVIVAFVTLVALAALALVRRWAPASPLALTLLAFGHRVGAARVSTARVGMAGASATQPPPSSSSARDVPADGTPSQTRSVTTGASA
jgi:NAD(P)H-quinone oxidoreductase subunit 5